MIVRLDFGRGVRRARALRVAAQPEPGADFVAPLGPNLPFRESSVDEIFLDDALAHVDDFVGVMEECWRISKPGTLLHARLPHASSSWAATRDPRHSHRFTLETFNYFDPRFNHSHCTSPAVFQLEHARLCVAGGREDARGLALARGVFSGVLESIANQHRGMQYRWERWFAPLIGGFEEFYVVLSAVKATDLG